ncbi:MAG: CPBP family intramembrane metalloprotease [Bacteroidales bacterium]|nr:CPBP family intramembrane metalloprotease [Bacteroidales bacterium]
MKLPFATGTILLFLLVIFSTVFFGMIIALVELITPLGEHTKLFISQIGTWLIPTLLFARYAYERMWDDLKLKNFGKWSDYGWFILLAVIYYPFAVYMQKINEAMTFPESMAGIEQFLRNMEQQAEAVMMRMVSGTSPTDLALALLNMAILPAICEELFFRGVVLNNLMKRTSRIHSSVWLSAILFSFIHFQFYGFLPRLIMGAVLGYAFVLSKSLWVPILLHFLKNATVTGTDYLDNTNRISQDPHTMDTKTATLWMAVLSLIASITILWCATSCRNKRHSSCEETALSDPPQYASLQYDADYPEHKS